MVPVTEVYWARPPMVAPELRALLEEMLDEDERTRAGRLAERADRDAFVTAHATLRYALSLGGDRTPRAWRFRAARAGKPELANPGTHPVAFSLSHTRAIVACVIASAGPVGIDVEVISDSAPDPSLLALCCTAAERAHLEALDGAARAAAFTELWTMKEAALKASGGGLQVPMQAVECALDPPRIVRGPPSVIPLYATVRRPLEHCVVAVAGPARDRDCYPVVFCELFATGAASVVMNSS